MADVLGTLAGYYQDIQSVPGIDWAANEQPRKDPARANYLVEMQTESAEMVAALRRNGLWDTRGDAPAREAKRALDSVKEAVTDNASRVVDALGKGELRLASDSAVAMKVATMATAIASAGRYAEDGARMHFEGPAGGHSVMYEAMLAGKITREELMTHADDCIRVMRTIIDMDKKGGLSELKQAKQMSGLGVIPVAVILIASVVALLALAAILYWIYTIARAQERAYDVCEQLAARGESSAAIQCVREAGDLTRSGLSAGAGRALAAVGIFGGIALLGYVTVRWILPAGVKQLSAHKKAAAA